MSLIKPKINKFMSEKKDPELSPFESAKLNAKKFTQNFIFSILKSTLLFI